VNKNFSNNCECINNYYPDIISSNCIPCTTIQNCIKCTSVGQCYQCANGFFYNNELNLCVCLGACLNINNGTCNTCIIPNCLFGTMSVCLQCQTAYYLTSNIS